MTSVSLTDERKLEILAKSTANGIREVLGPEGDYEAFLEYFLTNLGYPIHAFAGIEAVKEVAADDYDLELTDAQAKGLVDDHADSINNDMHAEFEKSLGCYIEDSGLLSEEALDKLDYIRSL